MDTIEGNRVQHEAFDRFKRELEEYAISKRERVLLRWAYQQGFNAANAVHAATPQPAAPVATRIRVDGQTFATADEVRIYLTSDEQPAAPVARSAEAEQSKVPTGFIEVRPGLYERQRPAPNWDQPPDHQAGDESDGE